MLYPARGSRLLGRHGELAALSPIVMAHQERPDGLGYPRGLRQPDIPCMALRIAVADATDAMGSHRPYAAPMTVEEIGEELRAGAGACWDYAPAMLAAQELSQNGRFLASPWLMSPPLRAPALSLSEGHHTSAPSIETTS
jgi:HD-GYP domain-containing protein (c-di-GMP phosphodiesterase class II)